jgi:ankyrin repeat protein
MKGFICACFLLAPLVVLQAFAEELPEEAQTMLNDLGSSTKLQQKNNGKTFRCAFGGRKTVTISHLADATLFSGDYDNCREPGSNRDGYFEVIVRDWEIVGQSSKRSKNGELLDAVSNKDVTKVKALIRKGADINFTDRIPTSNGNYVEGWTPLMAAAMTGNADLARLLIKSGAWVNYMNSSAVSALWLAAGNGNLETVKLLVSSKAYLNNRNSDDITPLMNAALNGHNAVVKFLIQAKADVNLTHKDGDSALMFALAHGHSESARLLIDAGADMAIQNHFGVTALFIAVAENNEEMVRYLITRKADLKGKTANGLSILDVAQAKGNESIIRLLKQAMLEK